MVKRLRKAPLRPKSGWGCFWALCVALLMACLSFELLIFHERENIEKIRLIGQLQAARSINLSLSQYAIDHDGRYPEGRTSTEVFQELIDGGYVSDSSSQEEASGPQAFYFPMSGKVKPASNILKPENVCWDITCCLDPSSSENIPVVYTTGYKVTYQAGASAVPQVRPTRTWGEWLTAADYPRGFIVVGYHSNSTIVLKAAVDGSIPDFISADFHETSKMYRQLTPDGTLPK